MQVPSLRSGKTADKPVVIGEDDGGDARLVLTTGLVHGIVKGQQRWVKGTGVDPTIESGLFIEIELGDPTVDDVGLGAYEVTEVLNDGQVPTVTAVDVSNPSTVTIVDDGQGTPTGEPEDPADEDYEALLAQAHTEYEADEVAGKSIPNTILWIGDDLVRAEVVEARESAKGDEARKGVMEHVTAMLEAPEDD